MQIMAQRLKMESLYFFMLWEVYCVVLVKVMLVPPQNHNKSEQAENNGKIWSFEDLKIRKFEVLKFWRLWRFSFARFIHL